MIPWAFANEIPAWKVWAHIAQFQAEIESNSTKMANYRPNSHQNGPFLSKNGTIIDNFPVARQRARY